MFVILSDPHIATTMSWSRKKPICNALMQWIIYVEKTVVCEVKTSAPSLLTIFVVLFSLKKLTDQLPKLH